ncbi:hypothetical protein ACHAQJ_000143 [Trichoderma viride]
MSEPQRREELPSTFFPNRRGIISQAPIKTSICVPPYQFQRPQQQQQQAYTQEHQQHQQHRQHLHHHHHQQQQQQRDQLNYPQYPSPLDHNGQPMVIRANGIQPIALDRAMMSQIAASPITQLRPSSNNKPLLAHTASPMPIASPPKYKVSAQVLGDVAQFNQAWTDASQKRNETSQRLINSFGWDGTVLTNQGLPLVDRQRILLGNNNVSSMDVCPDNFSSQESCDTLHFTDQWIDSFGQFSPQSSTTQPALAIEYDQHRNMHGYLDERQHHFQSGDRKHTTSHPPSPQEYQPTFKLNEQQSLHVKLGLDQMVESLHAQYQQMTMGSDVSGCGHSIPGPADENPQTFQGAKANSNMRQSHHPEASLPLLSFICPYAMRFPDRVNHNCFQRLFTIPYLKQHLRSIHHDAMSCPHQCQKQKAKPGTSFRRRRSTTALCYDKDICPQINKQRSNRLKTHKQQWERIYQILFPEANRSLDPYIEDLAVKQLRRIYKFMEDHGSEHLAPVYDQLLPIIRSAYPEPGVLYRIAFCMWLPRVFEQRFSPQGQKLLGDFLNQVKSVQRDNSYALDDAFGSVSRENSASALIGHQLERQGASLTSMPPRFETVSYQSQYLDVPTAHLMQQQCPFEDVMTNPLFEPQHDFPPYNTPYFSSATQPQTDAEGAAPPSGIQGSEHKSDSQDFLFDQCSPTLGSPSQFLSDASMDIEEYISQTSAGEFYFHLDI